MYRKEFANLIKLATPLVIAQLAQNTLSFVDTLMVGRLGNEALAGIAIGSTVFHFVLIVLSGVIFGVGPTVSQAIGANDEETASRAVRQGLWVGLFLFLPAFIFYWNAFPVLIFFGQNPDTAMASSEYLRAISWGLLPALWMMALRGFLEGNSDTKPIMVVAFLGIGANILFNYILMYGKLGLPALGLVGTGYASSIVYSLGFLILAGYVGKRYHDRAVFRGIRRPDSKMIAELFQVGGPIGVTLGFEAGMFSAAAIAMGILGKQELAAHQIALQTASISFMIPLGLAIATSVRVGHAIGRGSQSDARLAGITGMIACCGVMAVFGALFWLFPRTIISFYLEIKNPDNFKVVRLASGFLAIAALFQVVDGLQVCASSSLRGLKDTKIAMILTLISYWGIGVPIGALLCFWLGLRGDGLWWGMTFGLAMAAALLTIRFLRQTAGSQMKRATDFNSGSAADPL